MKVGKTCDFVWVGIARFSGIDSCSALNIAACSYDSTVRIFGRKIVCAFVVGTVDVGNGHDCDIGHRLIGFILDHKHEILHIGNIGFEVIGIGCNKLAVIVKEKEVKSVDSLLGLVFGIIGPRQHFGHRKRLNHVDTLSHDGYRARDFRLVPQFIVITAARHSDNRQCGDNGIAKLVL